MVPEQKDKVRLIYSELKGALAQAPKPEIYIHKDDQPLWDRFNYLVSSLVVATSDDEYKGFTIKPATRGDGAIYISSSVYRSNLCALISRLHGAFFREEAEPFSGGPATVISQTNSQTITTQLFVQLGMDLKTATDRAENESERGFVKALTEKVGGVKNYLDFLILALSTAAQFGVTPDRILNLFSK